MKQQHKNIRVAFGAVVAVATVLVNALALSAVQVDPPVATDAAVVEAVFATETASAGVATTALAPIAIEVAILSPIHSEEDASEAAKTPTTEATTAPGDGEPHIESSTDGSQAIIDYVYARIWGCFWYCTRIPYFCPCTVIYF